MPLAHLLCKYSYRTGMYCSRWLPHFQFEPMGRFPGIRAKYQALLHFRRKGKVTSQSCRSLRSLGRATRAAYFSRYANSSQPMPVPIKTRINAGMASAHRMSPSLKYIDHLLFQAQLCQCGIAWIRFLAISQPLEVSGINASCSGRCSQSSVLRFEHTHPAGQSLHNKAFSIVRYNTSAAH